MAIRINGNVVIDDSQNSTLTGFQSVTGNVTGGNIRTTGTVSATGNVTGGNIATAGTVSATGNVTGGNLNTAGTLSASGNVLIAGNVGVNLGGAVISSRLHVKVGTDQNIGFNSAGGTIARISAFNDAFTNSVPIILNGSDVRFTAEGVERGRFATDGVFKLGGNSAVSTGELFLVEGASSGSHRAARINNTGITNGFSTLWLGAANDGLIRGGSTAGTFANALVLATSGANPVAISTNAAERMRVDTGGNVLIGYTTSNGSFPLQVNGQIFATNATINTSDRRYKENVTPVGNSLTLINSLTPVSFDWKEHSVHNFSQNRTVGFIAQDVANVLAGTDFADSVVQSNQVTLPDGTQEQFYGVSETSLIPLLVRAIQELKAELDAVKQQLI